MYEYIQRLSVPTKRLLVGFSVFLLCFISALAYSGGMSKYPGLVLVALTLPFGILLPKALIAWLGNTGIAAYSSLLWGMFAASFVGTLPQWLLNIRNVIALLCLLFALLFWFYVAVLRIGGP